MPERDHARARSGWLTKKSLAEGLTESAVWIDDAGVTHRVRLRQNLARPTYPYEVSHVAVRKDNVVTIRKTVRFVTLTEARDRFKVESKH